MYANFLKIIFWLSQEMKTKKNPKLEDKNRNI
jgi:hypothetical protein